MSKEEILDIMRSDFDANFILTLNKNIKRVIERYKKTGETEYGAYGVIEIIAKSGQQYKFVVHKIVSKVSNNVYLGVATYFKIPTRCGVVYYTITQDSQCDFYSFDSDKCSVNRYTQHLVNRYYERGNGELYGEHGFVKMVTENPYFDTKPIKGEPNGIFGVTPRGAIIGNVAKGINRFNTFYSKSMVESSKFSKIHIDIETQQRYLFASIDITSAHDRYRLRKISAAKYASIVNGALDKVDDGFYGYVKLTKEEILEDVRKAIEEDSLRATESSGNTLLQGRPQKLCVCSCIQRPQAGV